MNKKIFIFTIVMGAIFSAGLYHYYSNSSKNHLTVVKGKLVPVIRSVSSKQKIIPVEQATVIKAKVVEDKFAHDFINPKLLSFNGQSFEVSRSLRSVKREKYEASFGQKVKNLNGHTLFRPIKTYKGQSFPVVRNINTNRLGYLTGKMIVKLREGIDLKETHLGSKASLVYAAPHLNTYYLKPNPGEDLLAVVNSLRLLGSISNVRPEVIDSEIVLR